MSGSSSGEKTEPPTPKKIRDARQKGQVARSQEVVTSISLIAVIAYIYAAWGTIFDRLVRLMDESAALIEGDFRVNAYNGISLAFWDSVYIMLPILGITILAGFFANYFQFGSIFSFESIMPKLEKVNPASGFKRIFSMKQLIETLKSVLQITFLSILLYIVLSKAIGPFTIAITCGMPCITTVTEITLMQTLMYSAFAFIIVAVADFAYQRYSHTKSLMMSKDEVKREYKESEGDPLIKSKRKQLAQELIMGDGGEAARKSSAVVINPTHLAVVIDYRPDVMPLPVVTAKGRNHQAHYLRTQAEEAGVPIFRNVALARMLFADVEVNEVVPDELFEAVAEVLAWVGKNRQALYSGRLSHGVIDMDAGDHRPKVA